MTQPKTQPPTTTPADRPLTSAEWRKTPYAQSNARDPDGAVCKLLEKYGVGEIVTAKYRDQHKHNRLAWGVRFILNGKGYRVSLETLDVPDVPEDKLLAQVKRAVYYLLKSCLEVTGVFMSPEQTLFAFLEPPGMNGLTMFEALASIVPQLKAPDLSRLMLPPRREGEK